MSLRGGVDIAGLLPGCPTSTLVWDGRNSSVAVLGSLRVPDKGIQSDRLVSMDTRVVSRCVRRGRVTSSLTVSVDGRVYATVNLTRIQRD
jgi:hypothetical protein